MKKIIIYTMVIAMVFMLGIPVTAAPTKASIGINVLLNTELNDGVLAELGKHGKVLDVIYEIDALTMRVRADELDTIRTLPFVASANPDAERKGAPIDTVVAEDMTGGLSTWNLDAINVTNITYITEGDVIYRVDSREVEYDGTGVYVAVLDTGLVDSWRQYFPEERIAEEYAMSFGGGGGLSGTVSNQPNKWEHDADSHGTHVTSTILGYSLRGTPINGVAPMATIIPVKVLNQNGSGWSSVIARGITYIADLKREGGPLQDYPVIINMSLGGSVLDPVEKAAIDYALSMGVIIVASAGNEGEYGMGYPGAYEPVISVASAGWNNEWTTGSWWTSDVPEPTKPDDFYISDFSSWKIESDHDLDVAAPGSWIVGPYNVNNGQLSYYFLGGTSMASPHVAGIVALMAEKNSELTASQAEMILEGASTQVTGTNPDSSPDYMPPTDPSINQGSGLVDAKAALEATPLAP